MSTLLAILLSLNACNLDDLDRFPPHEEAIAWADEHLSWIEANRSIDFVSREFWQGWYEEARSARQPWRELMLARDTTKAAAWRVRRLRDLRDLIGDEAYAQGRMPSVVNAASLWRFR